MDGALAGREPLYRRLAASLRDGIAAGDPAVGEALPGEEELARRFGASRYTIRAALALLEEEGLILRRTGARATVIAREGRAAFVQSIGDLDQMLNYPADTRRQNLETGFVTADEALARVLGCEPGRPWFRIRALRVSAAHVRPLAHVEIFVLPEYAPVAKRRDHESTHVHEQLRRQFGEGIARARIELAPARVEPDVASVLGVEPGSPALVVLRRYLGAGGRVFEVTRTIHPEGRYVISMELERRAAR